MARLCWRPVLVEGCDFIPSQSSVDTEEPSGILGPQLFHGQSSPRVELTAEPCARTAKCGPSVIGPRINRPDCRLLCSNFAGGPHSHHQLLALLSPNTLYPQGQPYISSASTHHPCQSSSLACYPTPDCCLGLLLTSPHLTSRTNSKSYWTFYTVSTGFFRHPITLKNPKSRNPET
jgi:hypothetical protein